MSLVKPTLDTPFHIDFTWWRQNDREWRVFLRSLLGEEQESVIDGLERDTQVDWVDPQTGRVAQMDALQYLLSSHYAREGEEEGSSSMVESIFRVFLKNGNHPLSANELGDSLGRPPQTILRTLSGGRVYRGIRPVSL